jgi:hypothetical protein
MKKFEISYHGPTMIVRWSWGWIERAIGAFAALLATVFGVVIVGSNWPSPVALLGAPLALVGLYGLIVAFVNGTTIFVTPEHLAVRTGPLPVPLSGTTLPRARIRGVRHMLVKGTNSNGGSTTSHNLVVDVDGDVQGLLSLDEEAEVKHLAGVITTHLGRR